MLIEKLKRFRHTGDRDYTDRLIAWLLDGAYWFEVQLADDFEEGKPEWEVVCGHDGSWGARK